MLHLLLDAKCVVASCTGVISTVAIPVSSEGVAGFVYLHGVCILPFVGLSRVPRGASLMFLGYEL